MHSIDYRYKINTNSHILRQKVCSEKNNIHPTISTMSAFVPLSTSTSQVRPQYSIIDERQIQQYQESKYQPWSPESSLQ